METTGINANGESAYKTSPSMRRKKFDFHGIHDFFEIKS